MSLPVPMPVPTSMDAPAYTELTGGARLAYWARGIVEIIGVGALAPVAIILIGLPFVLLVRLLIELAQRF